MSSSSSSVHEEEGRNSAAIELSEHDESIISRLSSPLLPAEALSKYFCFCIPMEWVILPEEGKAVAVKNGMLGTIFLLLNSMIGSGILVQPYMYSKTGILLAFFEYFVVSVMLYQGVQMLVRCAELKDNYDFTDIVNKILGVKWGYFLDISVTLNNLGALISYVLIIGTLLKSVVGGDGNHWWNNIVFLSIMPIAMFTVPLCLIRNFGHLAVAAYFSIGIIASCMGLIFIAGPIHATKYDVASNGDYNLGSPIGAFQTLGDIVYALGFITAALPGYKGLKDKSVRRFALVTKSTMVAGLVMCLSTGLVGYLCFKDDVEQNILENFEGIAGKIFKIALAVHLILFIPGDFVIFRMSLYKLLELGDATTVSNFVFISSTIGSFSVIVFCAILLQVYYNGNALNLVIDVTGGFAGSIIYFIIPGYLGMKVFKDDTTLHDGLTLHNQGVLLCVGGSAIVVIVLIFVFL